MHPEKHLKSINEADVIISSIGTLIDTSITKFKA
jgi:hypothetical protein